MQHLQRALCASAIACALGSAGSARAQLLDVTINASNGASPQGKPTPGSFRPTGPQGQVSPNLVTGTFYSVLNPPTLPFRHGGIFVPAGQNVAAVLANTPGQSLLPATIAGTNSFKIRLDAVAGLSASNFDDLRAFHYHGGCFGAGTDNTAFAGTHPALVFHNCDALNVAGGMNGVTFTATSVENSPLLRIVFPSIGFDMTSQLGANGARTNRSDSLSQINEALFASGKANTLAAQLLGKPDNFVPAKGSLPEDGKLIRGSITVGATTRSFGFDNPGQLMAYLIYNRDAEFSDFGLAYTGDCHRLAGSTVVVGTCTPASASFTFLGIEVQGQAAANNPDGSFKIPALDVEFTSTNATSRQNAIDQLATYTNDNVKRSKFTAAYARYLAENSPNDPLVGNPLSAQGQLTRSNLDLDQPSGALKEDSKSGNRARDADTAGWMIGGRAGYLTAGQSEAEYVDAIFERGFRVREGSRMRLKVSMPLSYIDYGSTHGGNGGRTATLGLRTALETPIIDGKWVIEPSAAASAFYSSNLISSGALWALGLSSRYKLAPVGRGHLIIGNSVTYSSTLHIEAGDFATPKIQNTSVRNGLAYQIPYGRFLGRQGTVRASYTYTKVFGDQVFVDQYHEVSLSYGVASREASVKQIGEVLRLGLNGSFGHDFTAVSLSAGYKF